MFNGVNQKNYTTSFIDYYTERRVISDMIVQHDIGSAQQVKASKYLICAHQTKERMDGAKENIAIFHHLQLRKYYVELDGQSYPTDFYNLWRKWLYWTI